MTDNQPQNIVEAYKIASQAVLSAPNDVAKEYTKVIDFCENDAACSWDTTLKRNTLLFWSYSKVAEENVLAGKYEQALINWFKAADLAVDATIKIELGQKMLEITNAAMFSIPEKAQQIAKISLLLKEAYLEVDDEKSAEQMSRLNDTASYLLKTSKYKH